MNRFNKGLIKMDFKTSKFAFKLKVQKDFENKMNRFNKGFK